MKLYSDCKVYGPYKRSDNRSHVVVCKFGSKTTVSYPKFLVEVHIGRFLQDDETIHHINGDFEDNRIENLEIVKRSEHARNHAFHYESEKFVCPVCFKEFILSGKQVGNIIRDRRRNMRKTGPYCSRKCSGISSDSCSVVSGNLVSLLSLYDENHKVDGANSVKSFVDDNAELGI